MFYASALISCFLLAGSVGPGQTPTSFGEVSSQATSAREQNDVPRAIELYSQALQLNPQWADGWWFLGLLQYGVGSYPSARNAFTHFIELTPSAAPAVALRGLCEFETGEYTQALDDIQRGISLGAANQSHNAQILRYHEALLLTKLGRFEDALKSYAYFAQNKIDNPELMIAIGLAGLRIPLFPKEITADQQELLSATGNAAYRFMSGDENNAGQAFQDLFRRFSRVAGAHYLYGFLLLPLDPDAAIPEFKHELEISPGNEAALTAIAWTLVMRNNPSEALPYARKAAEIDPKRSATQFVLGRSLAETGSLKEGVEYLERASHLDPGELEIHIALARVYSRSGRKEDARRERLLSLQIMKNGASGVARP